MRNRLCRRLGLALLAGVLGVASLAGCDNTVNIRILQINLREIYPAGSSYSAADDGGAACEPNGETFDLKLLLLGNTPQRTLEQVRDGDLLQDCVFEVAPGSSDSGTCYFNDASFTFEAAAAQRLSAICDGDEACDEGWTCDPTDRVCERPLSLGVRDVEYVRYGNPDERKVKGRILSLIIDNSGSTRGMNSEGEYTETPSDPNDERLAASVALVQSLDSADRVGVFSLSGVGTTGVRHDSRKLGDEAGLGGLGFYGGDKGRRVVIEAINSLDAIESGGTPVWDAIVLAAEAMDQAANFDEYTPGILLVTDGYRKQDLETPEAAREEHGPVASFTEALEAVEGQGIPVFVVHLENTLSVRQILGRDARLEELACASGGAYYRMERPQSLKTPFQLFFQHLTEGYYRVVVGYEDLSTGRFPAGEDYALTASVKVDLGTTILPVRFQMERGTIRGRDFDSRVFVTKPRD